MKAKALTFLILVTCLITSCNPNSGLTPSSFEQQLLGTWFIKRRTINYPPNVNSGIQVQTTTDTAHCKVQFTGNASLSPAKFDCQEGLDDCNLRASYWSAVSPYINIVSQEYEIMSQSSNSLVLKYYTSDQYETIYELEKNYSDLHTTCAFTYSVEFSNPIPLGAGGDRLYISYTDANGITQSVDMTGLTTWSQAVSQNFAQSLHNYSYIIEFPSTIGVNNSGNNWATLATVKITDGDGTVIGQVGPKELCLDDNGAPIPCSDGTEPEDDFRIELNCTN